MEIKNLQRNRVYNFLFNKEVTKKKKSIKYIQDEMK